MAVFLFVLAIVIIRWSEAGLNISEAFTSHMVLQQANPSLNIPPTHLFGMAFLNETVSITGSEGFPGPFKLSTTASKNNMYPGYGNFTITVVGNESHPSYPGPYTINIQSFTINAMQPTDNVTLIDVYFGDVFLCSGQSNMEFNVGQCDNSKYERAEANDLPNIRLLNPVHTMSNFTLQTLNTVQHLGWRVASNETIPGFSCVCWISARLTAQWLYNQTGKKPYLGLIESDIGGTSIHFWAPGIVGQVCNSTGMLPSGGECASKGPPYYAFPGSIFNAMINPIAMYQNGLSIRQAVWYQGEADSGENDLMTADAYICELNGLIAGWREQFNSSTMPVIVVQLPSGGTTNAYMSMSDTNQFTGWDGIQYAQLEATNMNDYVGLVTTQDQGQGSLHYSYKQQVAKRVFLWTRYLTYHDKKVNPSGPVFDGAYKVNANDLTVYINFTNAGRGLVLKEAVNCSRFKPTDVFVYQNMTNVMCCEMGGVDTVRMKLDGWFWVDRDEQGHHTTIPLLWDWMPANVTVVGPHTIAATPILPVKGASVTWKCKMNQCIYLYSEAISVRKIMIGANPGCAIANSDGIPTAASQGPYDIVVDPVSTLRARVLAKQRHGIHKYDL
eukprot:20885_1